VANQRRTLDDLRKDIGPVAWFIREQRKTLGYTQEEFAMRVGVGLRFLDGYSWKSCGASHCL